IAHDFNNILTGIMGYAELLKMQFEDVTTTEGQAANIILKGAERAADLTQQLLGFARGGKYNPVPLNINKVIKEAINVSENIFEKSIKVKYDLDNNISTIEADENQLNQVLTNIIINAKDAMPDGGEIIIKTENIFINKEYAESLSEFKKGYYVKISITDTGIGMPKLVKDRIFEPFYTTKSRDKGTGLGLATVYGIIKNHCGHINCYSEPGEGTTFSIYLPVSEKEIIKIKKPNKNVIKGTETILVVDDEENVRSVTKMQLEKIGYKVLLAGDGNEAVNIYKKEKDEIALILLDIIMPNMAGKETYIKLKEINPSIKVILVSGFSQNDKATEILNKGALGFIQKPFKLHELSKTIRDYLEK
ncbi:response regulator, partial [bacterium]|nr:response regulator [bacterium]